MPKHGRGGSLAGREVEKFGGRTLRSRRKHLRSRDIGGEVLGPDFYTKIAKIAKFRAAGPSRPPSASFALFVQSS
jgi:hypothetical protein